MDFQMMCETVARNIFQCGRFNDPLGRLANTDSWDGLSLEEFSERHKCKAWAIISRLQNEYLDSIPGREDLYDLSKDIERKILYAKTNQEIVESMYKINDIVEELKLSEFPHVNYHNSNDKR